MNSLAFKAVASAQSVGDMAVYIDPGRTFDPDYAARCGVKIASLLLVRSPAHKHIFEIARDLIASGGTGILVVGSDPCTGPEGIQTPSGALERLNTVLSGSLCAVIVLNAIKDNARIASANNALPYYATIRLQIEKERWLRRRRDIRGYRAWVTVLKNKLAPAGQRVTIAIGFSGVVRGDGA